MLLLRLLLIVLGLALAAYGVYAAAVAELLLPTFNDVRGAKSFTVSGTEALLAGLALLSGGLGLVLNMAASMSRHPPRELMLERRAKVCFIGLGLAFISALAGWGPRVPLKNSVMLRP